MIDTISKLGNGLIGKDEILLYNKADGDYLSNFIELKVLVPTSERYQNSQLSLAKDLRA